MAVSADRIVAGAPDADPQGAGSGQAWVVNRSSGDINPLVRPGEAAGDHYGRSVAADGDDVAVGADGDDDQGGDSGSVYRFRVSGGVLTGAEKHLAPDGEAGDGFGRSVALDATSAWLVAGAPGWDGGTPDLGSGYAFEYPPAAAAPGELRVTTNPAVASTILVDGIPRDQWGLTWLDLPDGTYEVCFTDVPGFVTPPCEDATVVAGQTATVQGDFVAQATLQVLTSPPVASTITLQDLTLGTPAVAANKWGVFRRVTPDHAVRVCFGPVAGWNPPPCQDVPAGSLGSGEFAQATGVFTENASAPGPVGKGELRVTTDPALAATILVDQVPRDEWGLTWLELDPGTYEVCATDVPGYSTPACTQAVVQGGVTTQLSLTFTQLGYLRILTEPAQEATVSVDGVPRNDWGAWFPLELGPHEVCFGPAKGTQAQPDPPCQDVVGPGPGQTLTVTGTYP
ncbi:MAG: FG-GAP repeat protein [Acidimicrobiales bacterium]